MTYDNLNNSVVSTPSESSSVFEVPLGTQYLSTLENFELPLNKMLLKGVTGCGATTVAFFSAFPTVIAVPNVSMIKQKSKKHKFLIPLYGDIKNERFLKSLNASIEAGESTKVICTFDAVPRVLDAFRQLEIDPKTFNIVIDEVHRLFFDYNLRNPAIKNLLSDYKKFGNFCFITATPLSQEFTIKELAEIPTTTLVWNEQDVKRFTVDKIPVGSQLYKVVANYIKDNWKQKFNMYFFCNSTYIIGKILNYLEDVDEDNLNIVCRDEKSNISNIDGFEIVDYIQKPKKLNFLTSKAFEGMDIEDEKGKICIISSSDFNNTLVDVSTSMKQIAGRIRNSDYTEITHFVADGHLRYDKERHPSYEEYCTFIDEIIEKTKYYIERSKGYDALERESFRFDELYIDKDDKFYFHFDENKILIDKFLYKLMNDYKDITACYNASNISSKESKLSLEGLEIMRIAKKNHVPTLQEAYNEHQIISKKRVKSSEDLDRLEELERIKPIIKDIFKYGISEDELQSVQWRLKEIRKTIISLDAEGYIRKQAHASFKLKAKYSVKEIIDILSGIYEKANKNWEKAKGSHIKKYFTVSTTTKLGEKAFFIREKLAA